VLTLVGSAIGAAIVGLITDESIKIIVTVAMFTVVVFSVLTGKGLGSRSQNESEIANANAELTPANKRLSLLVFAGYVFVFLLAIYGGLYSGGYVTILTSVLVAFFGMTYSGSIAATKVLNVFSSSIATAIFIYQGLVNFQLGVLLAVTMFAGAYVGAHYATKMNEVWLRRIFLSAVLLLAIKTIIDFTV
jgi:uncharacterized membrane protein YfcA